MEREKVIKWLEYDYFPRVGAYRKDCKQGCDACMPMHDGDDYCDIDMLCKILALLKEQDAQSVLSNRVCEAEPFRYVRKGFCPKCNQEMEWLFNRKHCGFCGQAVKWE